MKRMLMVATVPSMIGLFNMNNIHILIDMGYEVHVACNFKNISVWDKETIKGLINELKKLGAICHNIRFGRAPFSKDNYDAYRQMKKLIEKYDFNMVHCHTPIAAAISRIASIQMRRKGGYVIYTCHGFHFHKKAGLKNWLIYYPIERMLAPFTDMIITINKEDYMLSRKFGIKETRYIPGVGVDVGMIEALKPNSKEIRSMMGIPEDAFVILSIGELSERKNQSIIIKAISEIDDKSIYYVICGAGVKEDEYRNLAKEKHVDDRVIITGQKEHNWVMHLCHAIDLGAIPSTIEGLGLAGIEILAAGKPLIGSDLHGIKDYIIEGKTGIKCNPYDIKGFVEAIEKLKNNKELYNNCCVNAIKIAKKFDISIANERMIINYKDAEQNEQRIH